MIIPIGFDYSKPIGMIIYIALIIAFTYFYAFVQVNPEQMSDNLKKQGVKIKYMHYPLLGFLAILQLNSGQLQQIIDLYHELKGMKLLKWHQEFVLFMAVQMAIYDMAKVQQSLSMAIMSSIELLIQAQQAAMISAMTAAAVASNSSTS